MKKIIILGMLVLCLTGCNKKVETNKEPDDVQSAPVVNENQKKLEDQLIEYGKLIYENDTWLKGGIEPNTYFMTLREMNERNKYDITMFVNPETDLMCDIDNTRIEFIVKEKTENKTEYEYHPVLDCGF